MGRFLFEHLYGVPPGWMSGALILRGGRQGRNGGLVPPGCWQVYLLAVDVGRKFSIAQTSAPGLGPGPVNAMRSPPG